MSRVLRPRLSVRSIVLRVDQNIHAKFRVYSDESKEIFVTRSVPRSQETSPNAQLASAASLPSRFWSGAVAKSAPKSAAKPPPFIVWRDPPLQADDPPPPPSPQTSAPRPEGALGAAQGGAYGGGFSRSGRRNDSPIGGAAPRGPAPSHGCVSPTPRGPHGRASALMSRADVEHFGRSRNELSLGSASLSSCQPSRRPRIRMDGSWCR